MLLITREKYPLSGFNFKWGYLGNVTLVEVPVSYSENVEVNISIRP